MLLSGAREGWLLNEIKNLCMAMLVVMSSHEHPRLLVGELLWRRTGGMLVKHAWSACCTLPCDVNMPLHHPRFLGVLLQLELAGATGSIILWVLAGAVVIRSCIEGLPALKRQVNNIVVMMLGSSLGLCILMVTKLVPRLTNGGRV